MFSIPNFALVSVMGCRVFRFIKLDFIDKSNGAYLPSSFSRLGLHCCCNNGSSSGYATDLDKIRRLSVPVVSVAVQVTKTMETGDSHELEDGNMDDLDKPPNISHPV
jgi:hypothetical protein